MTRKTLVPAFLLLVAAITAACAGAGGTTAGPAPLGPGGGAGGVTDAAKGSGSNYATTPANGIPSLAAPDRDLIFTANVAMRSDDPWKTADAARQIARDFGGGILSLSESGSGAQRSATLTMRVPSGRFDDVIAALKKLDGEVTGSNVDAKDVTDQLVDLDARLTALRAEETRYLQLLASAKTVDEMLKVQIALSQLRTQIEQLAAQQKSTKDRVAFSNITVSIAPIVTPVPTEPLAKWDPLRTFSTAATALTTLLRILADLTIWLLVFAWIPFIAFGLVLLATRIRDARGYSA